MLKRLTKEDVNLIINFYHSINYFNEDLIRSIYDKLEDKTILCANIEDDKITSLLITNIIKNNYYIERILFTKFIKEEVRSLFAFMMGELRKDERGLEVIYDNFPYSEEMNTIMIENGLKCNSISMLYQYANEPIELINKSLLLNDKSDDVIEYVYQNYIKQLKSNDLYKGTTTELPDKSIIHLENTNIAVARDDNKVIKGTLRFGIVTDALFLFNLYAEDNNTYKDLLTLVKHLTDMKIAISVYPFETNLIEVLESSGFKKIQADYKIKIN